MQDDSQERSALHPFKVPSLALEPLIGDEKGMGEKTILLHRRALAGPGDTVTFPNQKNNLSRSKVPRAFQRQYQLSEAERPQRGGCDDKVESLGKTTMEHCPR